MGLFAFILVGLVLGLLARAVVPGKRGMGLKPTALFVLAGAFLGGLTGGLFYGRHVFDLHGGPLIATIMIAFTVLVIVGVRGGARRGKAF